MTLICESVYRCRTPDCPGILQIYGFSDRDRRAIFSDEWRCPVCNRYYGPESPSFMHPGVIGSQPPYNYEKGYYLWDDEAITPATAGQR